MINIFQINKGAYELSEIEHKFLIKVLNYIKDKVPNCMFLDQFDLDKITFKYAPEFLINDTGVFGAWSLIHNNTVYLRPSFIDDRFISYVKNNYEPTSETYKKYNYTGIYRSSNLENISINSKDYERLSYLAGNVVIDPETYDSLFITIIHELFHKYQFKRNPISYIFKSFIQLFVGYENSLKHEFFLEGEVREKIESTNNPYIFKFFGDFANFFSKFSIAAFYIDKNISLKNKLNEELTPIEKAETEEALEVNQKQIEDIKAQLNKIDNDIFKFCLKFLISEGLLSDNFMLLFNKC